MPDFVEEQPLRKPYINGAPSGTAPMTVLFSLLSRADDSPLNERRLAVGHTLDTSGNPIGNPEKDFAQNGFEPNPTIHFEHWGEYWRKVHGVRFTHVEEEDDQSLDKLLRYEQLHRFAPGPTSTDAPPYRVPVDVDGKLWPTVIGHVEAYRRPRWDGVAYLTFASVDDIPKVFANDRVRLKIAPEDQAMFRDLAPVLARQHSVIASASGREAVTLVKLHVRSARETRKSFQAWWLDEHAPFVEQQVRSSGVIKRYAQLHNIGPQEPGKPFFHPDATLIDGVTLMSFSSVNDVEDFLVSQTYRQIAQHEALKVDLAASSYWTSIGMVVVNRIDPEQATGDRNTVCDKD